MKITSKQLYNIIEESIKANGGDTKAQKVVVESVKRKLNENWETSNNPFDPKKVIIRHIGEISKSGSGIYLSKKFIPFGKDELPNSYEMRGIELYRVSSRKLLDDICNAKAPIEVVYKKEIMPGTNFFGAPIILSFRELSENDLVESCSKNIKIGDMLFETGRNLNLKYVGLNEDRTRAKFVDKSNKIYSMYKENLIKGIKEGRILKK